MKNKTLYLRNASFLALFFVLLGYAVKFYPAQLTGFDSSIQTAVRGDLPALATRFWTTITMLGEPLVLVGLIAAGAAFCWKKGWKAEIYLTLGSFALMGILSTAFKYIYQRPRPSIEWLLDTVGYSFPSWHSASTMMMAGVAVVIMQQRMKSGLAKRLCQMVMIGLAILVAVSRIYIGVHYPTDILGGWLLALTLLQALYPFYDQARFRLRFTGKQK